MCRHGESEQCQSRLLERLSRVIVQTNILKLMQALGLQAKIDTDKLDLWSFPVVFI